MRFQNGSNKVVIELRVVQFWSEIILVISNRTRAARHAYDFSPNCTPLSAITIIYPAFKEYTEKSIGSSVVNFCIYSTLIPLFQLLQLPCIRRRVHNSNVSLHLSTKPVRAVKWWSTFEIWHKIRTFTSSEVQKNNVKNTYPQTI